MDKSIKRFIERAFGDAIWVEKATPLNDVASLIRRLRPQAPRAPLTRIGGSSDGGYLLPDDLDGIVASLSPGVATECGFDEELARRGIDVLMADASVEGPPVANPRFHFVRKFVDIWSSDETMSLEDLAQSRTCPLPDGDLMLQMDIEGAEYRVLAGTSKELLERFRILVIEFHALDELFSRFAFGFMRPVFEKLLTSHNVVHIHPNNCTRALTRGSLTIPPVMEFTFYRKDRPLAEAGAQLQFPHPLDAECMTDRPPIVLPQCWWR